MQVAEKTDENTVKDMKDIVALCKRRSFIFPASDIYGGLNGFWDYGPLGVELKNNLRDAWWKDMVITPPLGPDGHPLQIVGVDSAIIQNPKAWVASGHVGGFSDPMVDCRETKKRYRADHLKLLAFFDKRHPQTNTYLAYMEGTEDADLVKRLKKYGFVNQAKELENLTRLDFFDQYKNYSNDLSTTYGLGEFLNDIYAPEAKGSGTLTEPKDFNLMFETFVGATQSEDSKAYLRPETAQGIFLNYKNVVDTARVKMPFGIAQIGKAFRNEVNPRNFIFRSREFEQMEMEWFCHPSEAKQWREFWIETRRAWWIAQGMAECSLKMRDHDADELSHYAKEGEGTVDIEYQFPFTAPGFGELEGIAHRCDFDLSAHQEHSGQKLEYLDTERDNERYIPHVIEPAAGLTRGVLALICEAYTPDPERPSGVYLNFHPKIAPKKAAILPLTAKDGHPDKAEKLYMALREDFPVDLDIKQNIGKRYARQDEIGTPYCFTIDNDTLQDDTVTVRERNTMAQERVAMDQVSDYLRDKMKS